MNKTLMNRCRALVLAVGMGSSGAFCLMPAAVAAESFAHHATWHARATTSPGAGTSLSIIGTRESTSYAGGVFSYGGALVAGQWTPLLPFWNLQTANPRPSSDLDKLGILASNGITAYLTGTLFTQRLSQTLPDNDVRVESAELSMDLVLDTQGRILNSSQGATNIQKRIHFYFPSSGASADDFVRNTLLDLGFPLWSVDLYMQGDIDYQEFRETWSGRSLQGPPTQEETEYAMRDTRIKIEVETGVTLPKVKVTVDASAKSWAIIARALGADLNLVLAYVKTQLNRLSSFFPQATPTTQESKPLPTGRPRYGGLD